MLRVDALPTKFADGAELSPDHADPSLLYLVSTALSPAERANGEADVVLLRYHNTTSAGGWLSVGLRDAPVEDASLAAATMGRTVLPASVRRRRARVRVRLPAVDGGVEALRCSPWVDAPWQPGLAARVSLSLSPELFQALFAMLDSPTGAVEVDVWDTLTGVHPPLPAVARVEVAKALERIRTFAPAEPAAWGVLFSAARDALAASPELVRVTALVRDAAALDRARVLDEVAARLLEACVVVTPGSEPGQLPRMQLPAEAATPPEPIDFNLTDPRPGSRDVLRVWSLSGFFSALPDAAARARYLVLESTPDVLDAIPLRALAALPFDPKGLRNVDVSFRYTSVSGSARNVTLTLDAERRAADVTVAHNRMIAFSLLRRCTVLLAGQAPGALPGTYQTAQVPASLVSVIDAAALGLRVVTFEVDPLVLRAASAVEISLRSPSGDDGAEGDLLAQRVCTADARGGSIALPGLSADAPLRCVVRALPPAGIDAPARVLRDGPAPPSITVGWEDLARDLSCELIVARATSATSERYPYVAATVRARWVPEVFLLLGGEARRVRVTRSSPFEALSFEVKAEWVEAGDGVSDTVQRAGRWRAVTGERAEIDPATEPREEQPS